MKNLFAAIFSKKPKVEKPDLVAIRKEIYRIQAIQDKEKMEMEAEMNGPSKYPGVSKYHEAQYEEYYNGVVAKNEAAKSEFFKKKGREMDWLEREVYLDRIISGYEITRNWMSYIHCPSKTE